MKYLILLLLFLFVGCSNFENLIPAKKELKNNFTYIRNVDKMLIEAKFQGQNLKLNDKILTPNQNGEILNFTDFNTSKFEIFNANENFIQHIIFENENGEICKNYNKNEKILANNAINFADNGGFHTFFTKSYLSKNDIEIFSIETNFDTKNSEILLNLKTKPNAEKIDIIKDAMTKTLQILDQKCNALKISKN